MSHLEVLIGLLLLLLGSSSIPTPAAAKKGSKQHAAANATGTNSTSAHSTPPVGQHPACCQQVLTPLLAFLGATSLDTLKLPVLILSTNNSTLLSSKNRVQGALCVCGGSPDNNSSSSSHDWLPTKFGVRGSTSVKDFSRTSYALTIKAKPGLLGELLKCGGQGAC
jgi:hypothetical protein